jgi:hypothetical protein
MSITVGPINPIFIPEENYSICSRCRHEIMTLADGSASGMPSLQHARPAAAKESTGSCRALAMFLSAASRARLRRLIPGSFTTNHDDSPRSVLFSTLFSLPPAGRTPTPPSSHPLRRSSRCGASAGLVYAGCGNSRFDAPHRGESPSSLLPGMSRRYHHDRRRRASLVPTQGQTYPLFT